MLSHKLKRLEKFLELASSAQVLPNRGAMKAALSQARDCREQAEQLERKVIPRRQRLDASHLASGKVVMLGVIAAPEAQL
jgi:hypothetical protein